MLMVLDITALLAIIVVIWHAEAKYTESDLKLLKRCNETQYGIRHCECYALKPSKNLLRCKAIAFSDIQRETKSLVNHASFSELQIEKSRMSSVPADTLGNLKLNKIYLYNNKLFNVSMGTFKGTANTLEELEIDEGVWRGEQAFQNISDLDLKGLTNLKVLRVVGPNLEVLWNATFKSLQNLRELKLKSRELNNINPDAFVGLSNLKILTIDSYKFVDLQARHFKSLGLLEELVLSVSELNLHSALFRYIPNLRSLDVGASGLTTLPSDIFDSTPKLDNISFAFNSIERIDHILKLPKLRHLNLDFNNIKNITSVSLAYLKSLEFLDLRLNDITHMAPDAFNNCPNLSEINLSYNKMKVIPKDLLANLRLLKKIKLGGNDFTEVPIGLFRNNHQLENLELRSLAIRTLPEDIFCPANNSLKDLNLKYNKLTNVTGRFKCLKSLETLDLTDNDIVFIPENELAGSEANLKAITLTRNPFKCCNMTGFMRWYRVWFTSLEEADKEAQDAFMKNLVCKMPDHTNKLLKDIPEEMSECRSPVVIIPSALPSNNTTSVPIIPPSIMADMYLIKNITLAAIILSLTCMLSLLICFVCYNRKTLIFSLNHYKSMGNPQRQFNGDLAGNHTGNNLASKLDLTSLYRRKDEERTPITPALKNSPSNNSNITYPSQNV